MPPSWFDRLTAALVSALLGFGLVGLVAAEFGQFRVVIVLFVGGAAAYTAYLLWFPHGRASVFAGTRTGALVVVLAAGAIAANGWYHAEHLLGDAEPAAVNNAARELAQDGDLDIEFENPFSGEPRRLGPPGLFTALAGAIGWFGRDAMLWTGPFAGGAALLSLFALGARLVRPWVAFVVTATIAVTPAFVALVRDAFPEPVVMALVLAGIAALVDARRGSDWHRGAVGGALLGAAALARFDWILLAPGLTIYLGLELRRSETLDGWLTRRRHIRYIAATAVAFAVPVGLAAWLTRGEGAWFAVDGPGPGWSLLTAGALLVGMTAAWLRPGRIDRPTVRRGLVGLAVIAVAAVLALTEAAPEWLLWYLGPVAVAIGVLGAATATDLAARGRAAQWTPLLVIAGVTTLVWMVRPGLEPSHPAVMLRFLPLAIPGLLLAAGSVLDWLWTRRRFQEYAQTAALALAAGFLAFPAWYLVAAPDAAEQIGVRDGLAALCDDLGATTAVVVSGPGSIEQPIRGFCQLPVATGAGLDLVELTALAAGWQAQGRSLVLISDTREPLAGAAVATARPLPTVSWESLEATVDDRPREVAPGSLQLFLTQLVPPR